MDDKEARELVVIENLMRKNLSAIEEARGFEIMLSEPEYPNQTALAERLGVSQGQIANRLRLLKLPDRFQQAVISRELSASAARTLVNVPNLCEATGAIFERHEKAKRRDPEAALTDSIRYILDHGTSARAPATRTAPKQRGTKNAASGIPHPAHAAEEALRVMKEWNDSTLLEVARAIRAELHERGLKLKQPKTEPRKKPASRQQKPASRQPIPQADGVTKFFG